MFAYECSNIRGEVLIDALRTSLARHRQATQQRGRLVLVRVLEADTCTCTSTVLYLFIRLIYGYSQYRGGEGRTDRVEPYFLCLRLNRK